MKDTDNYAYDGSEVTKKRNNVTSIRSSVKPALWSVGDIIGHLENFRPESKVWFQDRLGRLEAPLGSVEGCLTLDVIIGVVE